MTTKMKYGIFLFACLASGVLCAQPADSLDFFTVHVDITGYFAGHDPNYHVEVIQEGITISKVHTTAHQVSLKLDRRKAHLVLVNHLTSVPEQAYFPAFKYAGGEEVEVTLHLTNIVCRLYHLEPFPVLYYGQDEATLRPDQLHKLSVIDSLFTWERKLKVEIQASEDGYESDEMRMERKRALKRLLVDMGIPSGRMVIADLETERRFMDNDDLEEVEAPYAADRRVEFSVVGFDYGGDTR